MNPRSAVRFGVALIATIALSFSARADDFRYVAEENSGQTQYRIVDPRGATLLVIVDRAEYASAALRAADIAERMDRAVDHIRDHGRLFLQADWSHGQPTLHQVSRDGTIRFMIASLTPADLEAGKGSAGSKDLVELTRVWMDSLDSAIESAAAASEAPPAGAGVEADSGAQAGSQNLAAGPSGVASGGTAAPMVGARPGMGAGPPTPSTATGPTPAGTPGAATGGTSGAPAGGAPPSPQARQETQQEPEDEVFETEPLNEDEPAQQAPPPAERPSSQPESGTNPSVTNPPVRSGEIPSPRTPPTPAEEESDTEPTGIKVRVEPADAALYVDGRNRPLSSGPIPISPGKHLIEIVRPGYELYRKRVEIQPGHVLGIAVALDKQPYEGE